MERSEERRVGKEGRSLCDWSSDVCSSDLRSDTAGPFRLSYRMPIERHRTVMSKMEDFVWSHWEAHKPSQLSYRYVSIEGSPTDFLLFLEYSGEDRWRDRKSVV